MSVRICPLECAKDEVVQRRNDLWIGYSGATDFHPVSINVNCFIRAADNQRDWTGGRLIRAPVKLTGCDRLTLLAAPGKEQTWMYSCRRCRVCVRNDNSRAFHRDSE